MAYCTLADVLEEISEEALIELTGGTTAVDEAVLATAIHRADAICDSFLAMVTVVPVETPSQRLIETSVDETIYALYARTGFIPDTRKDRHVQAIAWLQGVAQGRLSLGDASSGEGVSDAAISYTTPEKDLGDDAWEMF